MRPPPVAVEHGKNTFFPCFTLTNNNRTFRLERCLMAIKGFDSKVKNAKSCDGSLGLLRVRISMTEGWIMVYGRPLDVTT